MSEIKKCRLEISISELTTLHVHTTVTSGRVSVYIGGYVSIDVCLGYFFLLFFPFIVFQRLLIDQQCALSLLRPPTQFCRLLVSDIRSHQSSIATGVDWL